MPLKHALIHTWFLNILASLALLISPAFAQTAPLKQHLAPKPLPAIEYTDDLREPKILDAKGSKLTVIHFWATWCFPCVKELPELEQFAGSLGKNDISILTLSLDKPGNGKVQEFYKEHQIKTLPVSYDSKMKLFRALETRALPATVFINSEGKEIARIEGPADWDKEVRLFIGDYTSPR